MAADAEQGPISLRNAWLDLRLKTEEVATRLVVEGFDAVILFADLCRSTERKFKVSWFEALSASKVHNGIVEDEACKANGHFLKDVGDEGIAFFVGAEAAESALRCASSIMTRLDQYNRPTNLPPLEDIHALVSKIGIHRGKVLALDGRALVIKKAVAEKDLASVKDLVGEGMDLTARVISKSKDGQILVSSELADACSSLAWKSAGVTKATDGLKFAGGKFVPANFTVFEAYREGHSPLGYKYDTEQVDRSLLVQAEAEYEAKLKLTREDYEEKLEKLTVVPEMSDSAVRSLISQVLEALVIKDTGLAGPCRACLWIPTAVQQFILEEEGIDASAVPQQGDLYIYAQCGIKGRESRLRLNSGEGLAGWVYQEGHRETVGEDEAFRYKLTDRKKLELVDGDIRAMHGIPILSIDHTRSHTIGVLTVDSHCAEDAKRLNSSEFNSKAYLAADVAAWILLTCLPID